MLSEETHEQQKKALMEGTIQAVVDDGIVNATARTIGAISGVNEVYIYRYFKNKNDLLAKTFDYIDTELLNIILDNFSVIDYESIDYIDRCRLLFDKCWYFVMKNPKWSLFYIRYYYSTAFQDYSSEDHMRRYEVLIEKMKPACHRDANVETVLHHVLDTLLGQARKQIVYPQDEAQAKDDTFWLIYSVLKCGKGI